MILQSTGEDHALFSNSLDSGDILQWGHLMRTWLPIRCCRTTTEQVTAELFHCHNLANDTVHKVHQHFKVKLRMGESHLLLLVTSGSSAASSWQLGHHKVASI